MALSARGMDPLKVIEKLGAVRGSSSARSVGAIQRALDLAGSGYYLGGAFEFPGETGACVVVPAGGEWYHDDLVIPNNVSLIGLGRTTSSLRAVSGTVRGVEVSEWGTLGNLFLRAANVTGEVIEVVGARAHVHGIHIHGGDTAADGIVADPGASTSFAAQFSDILIESVDGVGITSDMSDCQWSNIWVGSGAAVGLNIGGSQNGFTNLHVWERGSNGVVIGGNHNRITNAYIETNFTNGAAIYGKNNKLINADVWKNGRAGVLVSDDGSTESAEHNKFIGGSFRQNKTTAGIELEGAKYTVIDSSDFDDPFFTATWAVQETTGANGAPDHNKVTDTCFGAAADFSAGLVSLSGANSTSAMNSI